MRTRETLHWRDLTSLLAAGMARWSDRNAPRLGAALAFYTLLSITPLLVVVTAIGGMIFGSEAARNEIASQAYAVAGPVGAAAVASILSRGGDVRQGLITTVFGFAVLFFSATAVLIELREALNTMWDVPTAKRTQWQEVMNIVHERLFASVLVLCIGFFLLLSLAANVYFSAIARWGVGTGLIPFLFVTGLFAVIFKFLPDLRLRWAEVLPGALTTSLLFEPGRLAIAFYLARADFGTTWGPAASTTALLLWVYYSSQIFFFGAAITKELHVRKNRDAGAEALPARQR